MKLSPWLIKSCLLVTHFSDNKKTFKPIIFFSMIDNSFFSSCWRCCSLWFFFYYFIQTKSIFVLIVLNCFTILLLLLLILFCVLFFHFFLSIFMFLIFLFILLVHTLFIKTFRSFKTVLTSHVCDSDVTIATSYNIFINLYGRVGVHIHLDVSSPFWTNSVLEYVCFKIMNA